VEGLSRAAEERLLFDIFHPVWYETALRKLAYGCWVLHLNALGDRIERAQKHSTMRRFERWRT